MIINIIIDLENHLQKIDDKFQKFFVQKSRLINENIFHQQHLEEKRDNTKQYFKICAEIAKHMNQFHFNIQKFIRFDIDQAIIFVFESFFVRWIISVTIEKCKKKIVNITCELKNHFHKINSELKFFARVNNTVDEEIEKKRIQKKIVLNNVSIFALKSLNRQIMFERTSSKTFLSITNFIRWSLLHWEI